MPISRLFRGRETLRQYAALPVVESADGRRQVGLVTSRDTGRWVLPKGWPKPGLTPAETAAAEAREEAGLLGEIALEPVGTYRYGKRLHWFASVDCIVEVYPLTVSGQLDTWREQAQREVVFFEVDEAASLVDETDLAQLIRDHFAGRPSTG